MNKKIHQILLQELLAFLDPLLDAVSEPDLFRDFTFLTGWNLDRLLGGNLEDLRAGIQAVGSLKATIEDISDDNDLSLEEIVGLFQTGKEITDGIIAAIEAVQITLAEQTDFSELPKDFLEVLMTLYLLNRSPLTYRILHLLTIIEPQQREILSQGGLVNRGNSEIPVLNFTRLGRLFTEPGDMFRETYWPAGLADRATTYEVADRLFPRIAKVLQAFAFKVEYGWDGAGTGDTMFNPEFSEALNHMLSFAYRIFIPELGGYAELGLSLGLIPEDEEGPGVSLLPEGELNISQKVGNWNISLETEGDFPGVAITSTGFRRLDDSPGSVKLKLTLEPDSGEEPDLLIGSASSTHLEVGNYRFVFELDLNDQGLDYGFKIQVEDAAIVINGGDGDGFLAKVLPEDGVAINFDFAFGWSKSKGVQFDGGAGLDLVLNINKSILEVIMLNSVHLGLGVSPEGIKFAAALSAGLEIGPFKASVEQMGMKLGLEFPAEGGNFGPASFSIGFQPPKGIALSVDAEVIKGAGYLFFDSENNKYAGIAELSIAEVVTLKAICLLDTIMPDGSKGYSLLLIISAEFTPLPLGFGFNLEGVGGLVGVHRTMMLDVLQSGVRTGALDSILFPKDPTNNASKIISDLESIFPVEEGKFVFGPMGRITWGPNSLISLELGLLLEVPKPIRLAILGKLAMILPDEEKPVLKLQVAFVGVIDFEKKYLAFDASIYDSRILTFTLEGDLVLRLTWGENPNFLLSIGGFHPQFEPPPLNLPDMKRLTLSLLTGENPRITLEAYFALTSNTVQIGARLELYLGIGTILYIEGFLGFDALFQFSPFYFTVAIEAGISVMSGDFAILAIYLSGLLEGPTPWHIQGKAAFSILGLEFKVEIDKIFGEEGGEILPDKEVLPLLVEALADSRNWVSTLPDALGGTISIREIETLAEELLADPVSGLGLSQKVLPTEVKISKFGHFRPAEETPQFELSLHDENGDVLETEFLYDQFAPATFFKKNEKEKITGKSFERMKAGLKVTADTNPDTPLELDRAMQYEFIILRGDTTTHVPNREPIDGNLAREMMRANAISSAGIINNLRKGTDKHVKIKPIDYSLVSRSDQSIIDLDFPSFDNSIEAGLYMQTVQLRYGLLAHEIMILPTFETI